MTTVSLREAKAGLSGLVDCVVKGEFVTITRHGKPVAAIVPIDAAEAALQTQKKPERLLSEFLMTFPADDFEVERNRTPSRDIEF